MLQRFEWLHTKIKSGVILFADTKNTTPLWRRRSQSGAVFNEGEMKEISDYRFSSNCSTVMIALSSAAKVMPSADWGV